MIQDNKGKDQQAMIAMLTEPMTQLRNTMQNPALRLIPGLPFGLPLPLPIPGIGGGGAIPLPFPIPGGNVGGNPLGLLSGLLASVSSLLQSLLGIIRKYTQPGYPSINTSD